MPDSAIIDGDGTPVDSVSQRAPAWLRALRRHLPAAQDLLRSVPRRATP